jgi:hypothetical protein
MPYEYFVFGVPVPYNMWGISGDGFLIMCLQV